MKNEELFERTMMNPFEEGLKEEVLTRYSVALSEYELDKEQDEYKFLFGCLSKIAESSFDSIGNTDLYTREEIIKLAGNQNEHQAVRILGYSYNRNSEAYGEQFIVTNLDGSIPRYINKSELLPLHDTFA